MCVWSQWWLCLQSLPGPRHGPHGQHESWAQAWGHCSAAAGTPGSSRAERRAWKGEKINTYCTSLDSCPAHRHCGIAVQLLHPMDTLHGQGRATAGLGGAAALWTEGRPCHAGTCGHWGRGHQHRPELAGQQGPGKVGSAGWGDGRSNRDRDTDPVLLQCSPWPRGKTRGCQSFPHLYLK